ncbi:unnamed protein product, partial [Protopolystoma xenopodis]
MPSRPDVPDTLLPRLLCGLVSNVQTVVVRPYTCVVSLFMAECQLTVGKQRQSICESGLRTTAPYGPIYLSLLLSPSVSLSLRLCLDSLIQSFAHSTAKYRVLLQ